MIKPGYKAFNGHIFTQSQSDQYNMIQDRINAMIKGGFTVTEKILNQSHQCFSLITRCI